jgi:hypothetical protein
MEGVVHGIPKDSLGVFAPLREARTQAEPNGGAHPIRALNPKRVGNPQGVGR